LPANRRRPGGSLNSAEKIATVRAILEILERRKSATNRLQIGSKFAANVVRIQQPH
jgi:hypothetical protein